MTAVGDWLWRLVDVPWYVWALDLAVALLLVAAWDKVRS